MPSEELKTALKFIKHDDYFHSRDQYPKAIIKEIIKTTLHEQRIESTCRRLSRQPNYSHGDFYKCFAPLPKNVSDYIMRDFISLNKGAKINPNNDYLPKPLHHFMTHMVNALSQCDNNARWYAPRICDHCHLKTSHLEQYKMFKCRHYQKQRMNIIHSLNQEITFFTDQIKTNSRNKKDYSCFDDISIISTAAKGKIIDYLNIDKGIIPRDEWNSLLKILLGLETNRNLNHNTQQSINRMLHAHLTLLISMQHHETFDKQECTNITHNDINLNVVSKDIKEGKIIVRCIEGKTVNYRNIREDIKNIPIKELQNYNLGFGSATTRTPKQKLLANHYTNEIIRQAEGIIISSDGSISHKTTKHGKNKPASPSNISHNGGYGAIIYDKLKNKNIGEIKGRVKTNDSQMAELYGICASMNHIISSHTDKAPNTNFTYTILCDCYNAVKIINKIYNTPLKYKDIIQAINENIAFAANLRIKFQVVWIPGHTDNPLNDKADELAKQAADSWQIDDKQPNYSLRPGPNKMVIPPHINISLPLRKKRVNSQQIPPGTS